MQLKVKNKTYDVILNGTDYVTQTEPNEADFDGVFTATVDGEAYHNMRLAGISHLDDGYHISLYKTTAQETMTDDITDLQMAIADVYEMLI